MWNSEIYGDTDIEQIFNEIFYRYRSSRQR